MATQANRAVSVVVSVLTRLHNESLTALTEAFDDEWRRDPPGAARAAADQALTYLPVEERDAGRSEPYERAVNEALAQGRSRANWPGCYAGVAALPACAYVVGRLGRDRLPAHLAERLTGPWRRAIGETLPASDGPERKPMTPQTKARVLAVLDALGDLDAERLRALDAAFAEDWGPVGADRCRAAVERAAASLAPDARAAAVFTPYLLAAARAVERSATAMAAGDVARAQAARPHWSTAPSYLWHAPHPAADERACALAAMAYVVGRLGQDRAPATETSRLTRPWLQVVGETPSLDLTDWRRIAVLEGWLSETMFGE